MSCHDSFSGGQFGYGNTLTVVADITPGAAHQVKYVLADTRDKAPEPEAWEGAEAVTTGDDSQVVVTIPEETLRKRKDAPERVAEHLQEHEAYGDAKRIS